eukprot:jgi/Bigna1/128076/aug1.5_g2784
MANANSFGRRRIRSLWLHYGTLALLRSLLENHIRRVGFIEKIYTEESSQRQPQTPTPTVTGAELAEMIIALCSNRTNISGTTYKMLRKHLNKKAASAGNKKKKNTPTGNASSSSPESFLRPRISTDPNQLLHLTNLLKNS